MTKVKKLNSNIKVSKTHLKDLNETFKAINDIQLQIGGIEAHKHELLHTIALKKQALQQLQKVLKDVYGDVNIDLTTGTVTDAPNT
jgi:hypothetical protein